ncbi:XRE family transcriptional regulator [Anditalea andensis]|uniref:DNA-binding protein n=1 Tax=Anditalea andensis TaxID=1048983 RepID=A0A074L010_9BACT|nr:helix-turn-helix domain-containing protein [Anditalea andensis]KEO73815.1 DNA-binding protein [Anditalea andensis]
MDNQNVFWAANLKFLRMRRKYSQDEMAEKLGIKRSKLNAHENGHTKNPPLDDLMRLSSFFKMSIDTLIRVDLSKLSELKIRDLEAGNDVYITGSNIRVLATTVNQNNLENVELVPIKAKAGYLAGYSDPDFISKLPAFHLPQLDTDRKFRMFPTEGDSMLPVPEGAFVIGEFVQDWNTLKKGVPCIVVTREEGISFKLVSNLLEEKKVLRLESLNSLYSPYEVEVQEVLEIWKFHSYYTDTIPEPESSLQQLTQQVHEIKLSLRKLTAGKLIL